MIYLLRPNQDHECMQGWCATCKSYDCKYPIWHNRYACGRCTFRELPGLSDYLKQLRQLSKLDGGVP